VDTVPCQPSPSESRADRRAEALADRRDRKEVRHGRRSSSGQRGIAGVRAPARARWRVHHATARVARDSARAQRQRHGAVVRPSVAAALDVAMAVSEADSLELAGVSGYEGGIGYGRQNS
jgi:hypothetical protein